MTFWRAFACINLGIALWYVGAFGWIAAIPNGVLALFFFMGWAEEYRKTSL